MDFFKLREKLKYDIEHPKCKRCGNELYIPQPPREIYEKWGIMSWTAFVKQYAKHHGWHELENLNRNLVCNECLEYGDTPNTIILKSYDLWIENYNKWKDETKDK